MSIAFCNFFQKMQLHFVTTFVIIMEHKENHSSYGALHSGAGPRQACGPAAKETTIAKGNVIRMNEHTENLTAQRLRLCRENSGETLAEVGSLVGVNRSTVMRWEHGDTSKINLPTLEHLARHFGVNPNWLKGGDVPMQDAADDWLVRNTLPVDTLVRIPILGSVRAGIGGTVFQEIVGYEHADAGSIQRGETYFWLKVNGDSMSPAIEEGDLVLVRQQTSVDNGSYAVIIVGGEEGLVKKITYGPDWIELHSVNPYYPVRRFEGPDVLQVTVVGLVIESRRKF